MSEYEGDESNGPTFDEEYERRITEWRARDPRVLVVAIVFGVLAVACLVVQLAS